MRCLGDVRKWGIWGGAIRGIPKPQALNPKPWALGACGLFWGSNQTESQTMK